jgi:hypothetical protein
MVRHSQTEFRTPPQHFGLNKMPLTCNQNTVIPAQAGIQMCRAGLFFRDYSIRSPCGLPSGHSTRYALLSGQRRNDEKRVFIERFHLSQCHSDQD